MNDRIRKMVYAGLLVAIAIIIPIQFGFLKITIPPFTATLASHVPMFLAMLISPGVGIVVGIGSAIGFFMTLGVPVGLRALTHAAVGYVGGKIIQKDKDYKKAVITTAFLHGVLEGLVVIPFVGFDLYQIIIVTVVGTIIHHFVDSIITFGIASSVATAKVTNIYSIFATK